MIHNFFGFLRSRCFGAGIAVLAKAVSRPSLLLAAVVIAGTVGLERQAAGAEAPRKPNIVIILTDDQGYADVGCFGAKGIKTPQLDRMAVEGMRFTDFYAASSVCSPSRAALLTGCYPQRIGLPVVLEADSDYGLSSAEETIPQLLKRAGYVTGMFGKWHLGDRPQFLPTRHGFDEYFGLPYSNDMWPDQPVKKNFFPDLPLLEGERIVDYNPQVARLTTEYTERSVAFIEKNRNRPFFLYLAHNAPHVPLSVSEKYRGMSERGLYGDECMEIDWSVGEVLAALKRCGIDDRTLVVFFSDNGPWLTYGNHAGSSAPLRNGKTTSYEGGFRVPCIMRWPGQIPAHRLCREIVTAMDLLPTFLRLTGAPAPAKKIDGLDVWPLLAGQARVKSPHEAFFYYNAWQLDAVRSGPWKLILPLTYYAVVEPGKDGLPGKQAWTNESLSLYDLQNDIGEQNDVALEHPDVVERLLRLVAAAREDIGDGVMRVNPAKKDFFQARQIYRIPGKNARSAGR
jgi:arylsulfatase A-like enzyme